MLAKIPSRVACLVVVAILLDISSCGNPPKRISIGEDCSSLSAIISLPASEDSAENAQLAAASEPITVDNLDSLTDLACLSQVSVGMVGIAFSPDGSRVASSSRNSTQETLGISVRIPVITISDSG